MARRALVTGGNRGIGRAIAAGLAERGDDVVIACRDLAEGRSVAEGMAGRAVGFDLRQPESIDRAVAEVGDVDILVNNAGVIFSEPMLPHPRHFEETMAVMVAGSAPAPHGIPKQTWYIAGPSMRPSATNWLANLRWPRSNTSISGLTPSS